MENNSIDRLVTVKDALSLLNLGRTKFYSLVAADKIRLVRFGTRCVRVRQSDLAQLIVSGSEV